MASQAGPVLAYRAPDEFDESMSAYTEIIRKYLSEIGNSIEIEDHPTDYIVRWHFIIEEGISFFLILYEDQQAGTCHVKVESAIVDYYTAGDARARKSLLKWMSIQNAEMKTPFRFCYLEGCKAVGLQLHTDCADLDHRRFRLLLRSFIPMSLQVLQRLQERFPGIRPFLNERSIR